MNMEILKEQFEKLYDTKVLREYRFSKARRWRVDFYIPHYWLAIEIEGGCLSSMNVGRHISVSGYLRDVEKYNALATSGILLLRYTHKMIEDKVHFQDATHRASYISSVK